MEDLLDLWSDELREEGFRETRYRLFIKYIEREPFMVDLRGTYTHPIQKDLAAWIHPAHSDRFMPPERTRRLKILAKILDDLDMPIPYHFTIHTYERGQAITEEVRSSPLLDIYQ